MEDQNGASSDSVRPAPFSELISAWLDEGDRLDEKAIATTASAPPVIETRARRILTLLRPALDRYRVVVLAGVGLIPFALFALTHRSGAVPIAAAATVARVAPPSASPLARPAEAPTPAQAPTPPPEVAGVCEGAAAAPTLLELRSADPRPAPAPHHHHHHHHVAKQPDHVGKQPDRIAKQPALCGRGPCAVTPRAAPSAHAAVAPPSAHVALAAPGAHPAVAAPPRSAPVSTRIQPRR
jgi:hypothetical protein